MRAKKQKVMETAVTEIDVDLNAIIDGLLDARGALERRIDELIDEKVNLERVVKELKAKDAMMVRKLSTELGPLQAELSRLQGLAKRG